jgi:endonuclease/exonuclease/phosphatase family metal-dependent hydrolase
MKKIICLLLCALLINSFVDGKVQITDSAVNNLTLDTLIVATYNIRVKTKCDTGNRSWDYRKTHVAQLINSNRIDILGVQEIADSTQHVELSALLPAYHHFAKGSDDTSSDSGERIAIYYNKNRFSEHDKGFFFLSETPEVASKGWDAALNRICIWTKLLDNKTNKSLYFFNVHFDHMGSMARSESAKLLITKIKEIAGENFIICAGDFNASPAEIAVYKTMASELNDSKIISKSPPTGMDGTFNGWNTNLSTFTEGRRIDYIFVKKVQVVSYSVLSDKFIGDNYPSDHFPVIIKGVMNGN